MYKLIKGNTIVGYTDNPNYIKKIVKDDCYVQAPLSEATGIMYNETPYNLQGKSLDGKLETVRIEEFDGGVLLNQQVNGLLAAEKDLLNTQNALCDIYEESPSELTDQLSNIELALCDIYERVGRQDSVRIANVEEKNGKEDEEGEQNG